MLRALGCVAGVLCVLAAHGQVPTNMPNPARPDSGPNQSPLFSPKPDQVDRARGTAPTDPSKYKTFEALTDHEKDVVKRALMRGDKIDIQMATDICSRKCKECINGAECNLECAKKTCFKYGE